MKRLHRVLLRVEETTDSDITVVIPSWDADKPVKLLARALLPEGMPVGSGDYLLAEVNLDAEHPADLDVQEVCENLGPVTDMDDFTKAGTDVEQR